MKKPIKLHLYPDKDYKYPQKSDYDKSFITYLTRLENETVAALMKLDPAAESVTDDARVQSRLFTIKEIKQEFINGQY